MQTIARTCSLKVAMPAALLLTQLSLAACESVPDVTRVDTPAEATDGEPASPQATDEATTMARPAGTAPEVDPATLPDPALLEAQHQAAAEALLEVRKALEPQVSALIARVDALRAKWNDAPLDVKDRLDITVRELEQEVETAREHLVSLKARPDDDAAYAHGSLEVQVSWLQKELAAAESRLRAGPRDVPMASAQVGRMGPPSAAGEEDLSETTL